jgi:hypothetical protein
MRLDRISSTGNTQAGGAVTLDVSDEAINHKFSIEVSATPTTGTLTISGAGVNSETFVDIGTIDLTSADLVKLTYGMYDKFKFTPTSFDAGKTYDIHISSWE